MKKYLILPAILLCVITLSSCHSSELSYQQTYDKIKEKKVLDSATTVSGAAKPVVVAQTNETALNIPSERLIYTSGNNKTIDSFNLIAGSFKLKVIAEDLCGRLVDMGYKKATVAFNTGNSIYRVIVATFPDFDSAQKARDEFKAKYNDQKELQGAYLLRQIR
jgi:cell division septation protein DedD